MRLTLQEMVSGAIAEATEREKLAQVDEPKASKKEEEKSSSEASASPPKKEDDKEKEGCASSLVEKVASALDFINANLNQINWEKVAVGEGLGSDLQTNMDSPTPGLQSTETGQATGQAQPPTTPGSDTVGKKDGQTNPATALETDMADVPGGTGEQPQLKQAAVSRARQLWAMKKQAANAENPAQISAGPEPLVNPNASAAEEAVPKLPGPAQAQANWVQTKDPTKPASITKGQAKAEPKRQMGEVLDEPAQKKSTDPVLHQNLDAAAGAGVKLSSAQATAARAYLRKVAQAGEGPDASPEDKEKAKKLKAAVEAKKSGKGAESKEKESQGGVPPMAPPPVASGGMMGAGDPGMV